MESNTIWQEATMLNEQQIGVREDTQPPDDELAVGALHDPAQYATLYRRYVRRVYRYFYGRVGSAGEAEDLTSQLFLEVLKSLPRYRPQGKFAPWLFTLARRRAADFHRSQAAALPLELAGELTCAEDPLEDVLRTERLTRLSELYAQLDEERQELIRLRYGAGLTYRQVGQVLGRSEGAVTMALRRTLHWFQENWEVQDE
jgi:RNA polymerase sigma-70 factor, ECF subfamily